MIEGLLVMGLLGAVLGLGLAIAAKVFYVYVDPRIEAVEELLPGANCGGCGYPGCSANAKAIVEGKSPPSSCVAASAEVIQKIAEIVGAKIELKEPEVARPGCKYGVEKAERKYIYEGIKDCRAAVLINGGEKECPVGCLGLGTCVKSCPFGALSIGPEGLPVVDTSKCTGCGTCERVCPKGIIKLSSNSLWIIHEYTTDECTAPCQRACPAGVDIPGYIRAIREGKYEEALIIIKRSNPFPAVCSRICIHPCEYECRRNLVDEPVAINPLKRFLVDWEREKGIHVQVPRAPEREERIAIIGGGVEGLTAAYLLNRLGYRTKVYEATDRLGGLLWIGLPENRLPRDIIKWDIDGIIEAGVEVELNRVLGKDITVSSLLKEGYSAVCIATGGWDIRTYIGSGNSELPGIQFLLDFLLKNEEGRTVDIGKSVLIVEGGRSAVEAAKICRQKGAKDVYVIMRSKKEDVFIEGEEIRFRTVLTGMEGEGERLLKAEICEISDDGKRILKKEEISVDTIIIGAGRFPELVYVPKENGWKTISPYAGPNSEHLIGIFRPGEPVSDYRAAVEAIGAGRRLAATVHKYLRGIEPVALENMIRKGVKVLDVEDVRDVPPIPRQMLRSRSRDELIRNPYLEETIGFTEEQAKKEAERCLQCGLICYRKQ